MVTNEGGHQYQVLRPLLNDFVLSMPRGATVVYPKDSAQIVQLADVFPGAHVLEAGVGSGALSISLLRAVGEHGTLHSYELREEFAKIARANVDAFFGDAHPGWQIHQGDAAVVPTDIERPGSVDRVVLDMLTPWDCLDMVSTVLAPGGVWVSYVASVTQLSRLAEAVREAGGFTEPEAHEIMLRTWHLDGLAVRPDHRMVAHTGFLLSVRRLADGQQPLALKKREKVSSPPLRTRLPGPAPAGGPIRKRQVRKQLIRARSGMRLTWEHGRSPAGRPAEYAPTHSPSPRQHRRCPMAADHNDAEHRDAAQQAQQKLEQAHRQIDNLRHRQRDLEQQLQTAGRHNERITGMLESTRGQIEQLKEALEADGNPPFTYASVIRYHPARDAAEGREIEAATAAGCDVLHAGRKMRVSVSPLISAEELIPEPKCC